MEPYARSFATGLYRGEIAHCGEVHQGAHEAIIDEALWNKVQARLADQSHRLILGDVTSEIRSPDVDLVQLVRDGHRWFEDLRSGRAATIASIAQRDGQQASHVSRTISLAFLAPDIVDMILKGRQPIGLTPERLKAARSLPPDWNEQRKLLLD